MEVFLGVVQREPFFSGLLHARGGVSLDQEIKLFRVRSSPRSWRCFLSRQLNWRHPTVFSTLVEVFPNVKTHARAVSGSSPRSWRCFSLWQARHGVYAVFSTLVEVFPAGRLAFQKRASLLHARGGVSSRSYNSKCNCSSSPRSWRCFNSKTLEQLQEQVFSTLVEVFPWAQYVKKLTDRLLHARGGVSLYSVLRPLPVSSSPRSWRCFQ